MPAQGALILGAAPTGASGPRVACVFFSRVDRISLSHRLWHAMAHELGHLLLPGYQHSRIGLMRGICTTDDFINATQGRLRFSPAGARLLRAALDR
jgi:hypothetical protein